MRARQVIAGQTYLMTRRCTQRQFLLRPDRVVEDVVLYCLAVAAERFKIEVNGFIAMSNHQHLVIRDMLGNFPDFLAYHNKLVAKALNVHRNRRENFWATEQPNAVHLVEPEDRFAKLVYLLANPVASDLVDRVSDWPGVSSFSLHLSARTTMNVKRPRTFFLPNGKLPEEATLHLERVDGFDSLTDDEWASKIRDAVQVEEDRARRARTRAGRSVVGRKAVLRAAPTDTPRSLEERRKSRPFLACRNPVRRAREILAYFAFQRARRAAWCRLQEGESDVGFPLGTYRVWGIVLTKPRTSSCGLVAA